MKQSLIIYSFFTLISFAPNLASAEELILENDFQQQNHSLMQKVSQKTLRTLELMARLVAPTSSAIPDSLDFQYLSGEIHFNSFNHSTDLKSGFAIGNDSNGIGIHYYFQ